MSEKKLENYFDKAMDRLSKNPLEYSENPLEYYLLVMIGRCVAFKSHAIETGPRYIVFEQEFEKDFEELKKSHPDAIGTLETARPESKEMLVRIFTNTLGLKTEIARHLVMGDFERGITDVSKIKMEEPSIQELPQNPQLDGMAKRLFTRMRRVFADQTLLTALLAHGYRDWPESAQEILQLFKTAKIIDDNKTRKKRNM